VYGIVTAHKGFIEVLSKQGEGTTFKIFLPLTAGAVVTPPPASSDKFPSGTENLLIVDDEQALRHLLSMMFSSRGYKVVPAANGLEAMEIMSDPARPIDLVMLDLNMPGATGMEVLRVLNRCRPDVPTLVISGQLTPDVRAELALLNNRDQLAKPFALNELASRVRAMLDAAKKGGPP
jgi:two-component system cell cycle sensor histidine kinase/response regulator CckA